MADVLLNVLNISFCQMKCDNIELKGFDIKWNMVDGGLTTWTALSFNYVIFIIG